MIQYYVVPGRDHLCGLEFSAAKGREWWLYWAFVRTRGPFNRAKGGVLCKAGRTMVEVGVGGAIGSSHLYTGTIFHARAVSTILEKQSKEKHECLAGFRF